MSGIETLSVTVDQWLRMKQENADNVPPVWFSVTGNSMFPFIRAFRDQVMLVPVSADQLSIGDIVLFPGAYKGGNYCLHRIFQMEKDRVRTFGDGNRKPDAWMQKNLIIGKAVLIKRGSQIIDCEDAKWKKRFRWWMRLWRVRFFLMLPFRLVNKLSRVFGG